MTRFKVCQPVGSAVVLAFAASVAGVSPAMAGEITGNGKMIEMNARSVCAFSGLNDTPEGDLPNRDPGGRVQSFGYLVGPWDIYDPEDLDPNRPGPHPGWSCNPTQGPDLHRGRDRGRD